LEGPSAPLPGLLSDLPVARDGTREAYSLAPGRAGNSGRGSRRAADPTQRTRLTDLRALVLAQCRGPGGVVLGS
jgi:hypothetical protein